MEQSHPTAVLVVDDEPMLRMYASELITDAGFPVFEAANAEEAMLAINDHPEIGVLFTDIHMPGRFDGLELARKVHDHRPDVQLIITSGRDRLTKADLPDCGTFFPKPYRGADVVQLISAHQRLRPSA